MYNLGQSFYLDSEIFNNASTVYLTSVNLYFKSKPVENQTVSGVSSPGVSINITSMKEGYPETSLASPRTIARVEYSSINVSETAASSTKFTFKIPIPLSTNKSYCVLIKYDDPEFVIWKNRSGEEDIISGDTAKISSGKADGNYFEIRNGSVITPLNDVDLKFSLNFAKFTATDKYFRVNNEAYEFLKLSSASVSGAYIGGEYVYQQQANAAGSVAVSSGGSNVTGTSTDFGNTTSSSAFDKIANNDLIIIDNGSNLQVRKVNVVTNTTFLNVTSSFTVTASGANIRTFEDGILLANSQSNTIIGTNTSFNTTLSTGYKIVLSDGTPGNTVVREVVSVTNSTYIILDVKPPFDSAQAGYYISPVGIVDKYRSATDTIVLYKSNANSTLYFETSKILRGVDSLAKSTIFELVDLKLSSFTLRYNVFQPAGTKYSIFFNTSNSSYNKIDSRAVQLENLQQSLIDNYDATIASRSNEVRNAGNLFSNSKSTQVLLRLVSDNVYTSPFVLENDLDLETGEFLINNDSSSEAFSNSRFQIATFNANSQVNSSADFITVTSNPFVNNDVVKYIVSPGNTAVTGITRNKSYFVVSANSTGIKLSDTLGGPAVDISATTSSETGHTLRRDGVAYSKYVTKPITLSVDQVAEDLIVYMTAYKPASTDIEVYAKLLSEEDGDNFNSKNWSKLSLDVPTNSKIVSLESNPYDFVSLTYKIPGYQAGVEVSQGTFVTTLSNNIVTGSFSTVNTYITSNSLVRIYNPTFPNKYFIETVTSSNTTAFTLPTNISNNDLVGSGLKVEVISDKNSAFADNQNYNITTYYNSKMGKFTSFKTYAIKIVLKSANHYLVPRVKEYRAVALSA